jgi:hypothetical protein
VDVEGKGLNTGAHKAAAIFDEVEREQPGSTCSKAMSCRVSKSMTASVKALYSALPAFQHGGRHRTPTLKGEPSPDSGVQLCGCRRHKPW